MERWKRIRIGSGLLSLGLLAVLLLFPLGGLGRAFMIVPALAGAILFTISDRRICRYESDHHIIRLTNYIRHDWMNDLQVLLGLLRLNKIDKLQECLDKIKWRALQESNMSRLGIPAVIVHLLDLRTDHRSISLEVEIDEEIDLRKLMLAEEKAEKLIRSTIDCFAQCAVPSQGEPNVLSLSFEREDGGVMVDFVYCGASDGRLEERIREALGPFRNRYEQVEEHFSEEKAVLTLLLPFRT